MQRTALPIVVALALLAPGARLHAGVVQTGEELYASLGCAVCHGADGLGSDAGPSLASGELDLAKFTTYVRQPNGTMEPYGADAASDRELADVYAYLASLPAEQPGGANVERGAKLYYETGCYECHSNEAQGGAQGPRLGPNPVTFAMFGWYVRHPTGGMPPYTIEVLSLEELADIYAWVEARPEPPPLESIPLLSPRK